MKLPNMDFEAVQFTVREEVAQDLDAFIDYAESLGEAANYDNVVAMIVERFMSRRVSAPFRKWQTTRSKQSQDAAETTGEMRIPAPKTKPKQTDDDGSPSDVVAKARRVLDAREAG